MHIVPLQNILAAGKTSGGKGRQLALLLAQGLTVPGGFVIQAGAFDAFIDGSGIRKDLMKFIRNGVVFDPSMLARHSEEFVLRFRALPFPAELSQEIDEALAVFPADTFAVRSSSLDEDGIRVAWAGQFATMLAQARADVPAAVRRVWESSCSPHALASLARARVDNISMAVVVQRMIHPRVSGVLFTVDPTRPEQETLVVEAVPGHNNDLVSGLVTPDHFVLSRKDRILLERDVVHHDKPTLTQQELSTLGEIGLRIETILKAPADVEWAYLGNTLMILQARPVTGLAAIRSVP